MRVKTQYAHVVTRSVSRVVGVRDKLNHNCNEIEKRRLIPISAFQCLKSLELRAQILRPSPLIMHIQLLFVRMSFAIRGKMSTVTAPPVTIVAAVT